MIVLQYSTQTEEVQDIQTMLNELVLSHKIEEKEGLPAPVLISDQDQYTGKKAIKSFLQELGGELDSWYYCACK
ncbi:MAG: hypothetical protein AAF587_27135 [Bacteroidota bacterium]